MWNRIRQWLTSEPPREESFEADLKWHPGSENPFGVRILDCRSVTWNLISTTGDPQIAAQYTALRSSDGKNLIDLPIQDAVRIDASLSFPHNGAVLEGIASKSDTMEVKWDIYIYDSIFLIARSWTGELRYRAFANVGTAEIGISEIECCADDAGVARSQVFPPGDACHGPGIAASDPVGNGSGRSDDNRAMVIRGVR